MFYGERGHSRENRNTRRSGRRIKYDGNLEFVVMVANVLPSILENIACTLLKDEFMVCELYLN